MTTFHTFPLLLPANPGGSAHCAMTSGAEGALTWLDPLPVYFTFSRIRPQFSCGRAVADTLAAASSGELKVEDLPPIGVLVDADGNHFSLNNRRLFVFKQLARDGRLVRTGGKVPARVRPVPDTKRMREKYTPAKCALDARLKGRGEAGGGGGGGARGGGDSSEGSGGDDGDGDATAPAAAASRSVAGTGKGSGGGAPLTAVKREGASPEERSAPAPEPAPEAKGKKKKAKGQAKPSSVPAEPSSGRRGDNLLPAVASSEDDGSDAEPAPTMQQRKGKRA